MNCHTSSLSTSGTVHGTHWTRCSLLVHDSRSSQQHAKMFHVKHQFQVLQIRQFLNNFFEESIEKSKNRFIGIHSIIRLYSTRALPNVSSFSGRTVLVCERRGRQIGGATPGLTLWMRPDSTVLWNNVKILYLCSILIMWYCCQFKHCNF